MLFNSIEFSIFLPVVFIVYWALNKRLVYQNLFLLLSSYIFYGWWDWRFLTLILYSSLLDFWLGKAIQNSNSTLKQKTLLIVSILSNLGLLVLFKYFNFFIESFVSACTFFGVAPNIHTIKIILPVGISFYTFQTLSYSIDIYRKKITATSDLIAFLTFVSFFPQLVAGPIERAVNLLPQFTKKRVFNDQLAFDGLRQMFWGFFKKMVIADNCARIVNPIFEHPENFNGAMLLIGIVFFSFQIYGDFSGYSDIAIGTSKLFNIRLCTNFRYPYFSRDIAEFWRRWHISLSTWFRDYVYIPLGGSRGSLLKKIRNTFIIFLISGFWHGANWTFISWGTIHAILFIPLLLANKNRKHTGSLTLDLKLSSFTTLIAIVSTYFMVSIAWVFFRANSIDVALSYLSDLFNSLIHNPGIILLFVKTLLTQFTFYAILILLIVEWLNRNLDHGLARIPNNIILRQFAYILIGYLIIFHSGHQQEFIYFQF